MIESQNERIKKFLEEGNSITPIDALNRFDCFRLSARISDLRNKGMRIDMKRETKNGKTYARYSLHVE